MDQIIWIWVSSSWISFSLISKSNLIYFESCAMCAFLYPLLIFEFEFYLSNYSMSMVFMFIYFNIAINHIKFFNVLLKYLMFMTNHFFLDRNVHEKLVKRLSTQMKSTKPIIKPKFDYIIFRN